MLSRLDSSVGFKSSWRMILHAAVRPFRRHASPLPLPTEYMSFMQNYQGMSHSYPTKKI